MFVCVFVVQPIIGEKKYKSLIRWYDFCSSRNKNSVNTSVQRNMLKPHTVLKTDIKEITRLVVSIDLLLSF